MRVTVGELDNKSLRILALSSVVVVVQFILFLLVHSEDITKTNNLVQVDRY